MFAFLLNPLIREENYPFIRNGKCQRKTKVIFKDCGAGIVSGKSLIFTFSPRHVKSIGVLKNLSYASCINV